MSSTSAPVLEPAETVSDLSARRGHSPAERLQHLLHRRPALSPLAVLIIAIVIFSLVNARFYSAVNLSLVAQQSAVIGSLAVGQTLIILTAGIDLSCGMVMALGAMVMTKLAVGSGLNPYLAIVVGRTPKISATSLGRRSSSSLTSGPSPTRSCRPRPPGGRPIPYSARPRGTFPGH